jgi:hypothetical protein
MFSKKDINTIITNFRGWKTNRKIIVFESDDWGTIRSTNSEEVKSIYNKFNINLNEYNLYDCLEQNEDVEKLFDLLTSYKSSVNGRHPKFTANCIVKNPDFSKIEESDFLKFFTESVSKTFTQSKMSNNVLDLWKQGLKNDIFIPQLHGREHINSRIWLSQLQKIRVERELFHHKMWGAVSQGQVDFYFKNSMAGLNYKDKAELEDVYLAIDESVQVFYELFGYYSKSYIANNYIWDPLLEERLASNNVEFLQGQAKQLFTAYWRSTNQKTTERHFMGQKNKFNQLYLIRNCFFEPVLDPVNSDESVNECLKEIKQAFRFKKPAIISTHRVNYMGGISIKNRDNGLIKLDKLLKKIIDIYPDVEFLSSSELGSMIKNSYND